MIHPIHTNDRKRPIPQTIFMFCSLNPAAAQQKRDGERKRKIVSGIRGFFSFEGVMEGEIAHAQETVGATAALGSRFNPATVHLFLSVLLSAAAEIFLKLGADQTAGRTFAWQWLGLSGLSSPWVWLGILCMILGFASWTQVLRTIPLNVAFALANTQHVIVPLGCWWFLGESISGRRWVGILLLTLGLFLAAKPLAEHEEGAA